MNHSGKKSDLFSQSLYILLSLCVSNIIAFCISIIIARSLGPHDFGIYSLVISTQTIIFTIASLNLGNAISKFIAELPEEQSIQQRWIARIGIEISIVNSCVVSFLYFLLSDFIGINIFQEMKIVSLIPFSALVIISSSIQTIIFGIAQGLKNMRIIMTMQISIQAIILLLLPILIPIIDSRAPFVAIFIAQLMVSFFVLRRLSKNGYSLSIKIPSTHRASLIKMILNYSVPGMFSALLVNPIYWIGNTQLVLIKGFQEMALFSIAFMFYAVLLSILPNSIILPFFPRISQFSRISISYIRDITETIIEKASLIFLPIFLFLAIFSMPILNILYGSVYLDAAEISFVMISTGYFCSIAAIIGSMLMGIGKMRMVLMLNIIWAISFLSVVFILVPLFGVIGLGLTYSFSYGFQVIIAFILSYEYIRLNLKRISRILLVAIFLFIVDWIIINYIIVAGQIIMITALFIFNLLLLFILYKKIYSEFLSRIIFHVHNRTN